MIERRQEMKDIEARFRFLFVRALVALGIIGFMSFVAILGFGIVLANQSGQAQDIQDQRRAATLDECRTTNRRHDGAVSALVAGSDKDQLDAPNEAVRKEIRRRRDVTIGLLDALAPHQDCESLVQKRVKKVAK